MPRTDLGDAEAQHELHAVTRQHLGRVLVGPVRERREERVPVVDEADARLVDREVRVLGREAGMDHLGDRAGHLDTGRAAANDHEFERARLDERRVAVGVVERGRGSCARRRRASSSE